MRGGGTAGDAASDAVREEEIAVFSIQLEAERRWIGGGAVRFRRRTLLGKTAEPTRRGGGCRAAANGFFGDGQGFRLGHELGGT